MKGMTKHGGAENSTTHSFNSTLNGSGGYIYAVAALPPGKIC